MKRSLALFISLLFSASAVVIAATSNQNNSQKQEKTTKTILTQSSTQHSPSNAVTPELSPKAQKYLEDAARNITVRVSTQGNGGSGVLIGKQDESYLVLTNAHVILGGETFELQTADGQTHSATLVSDSVSADDDIALLQFNSELDYKTATLSELPAEEELIVFAGGYSAQTGEFVTSSGKVALFPNRTLKDGYKIGYTSEIESGMSGGPILEDNGELIGINGKGSFPILNTGLVYQDGTQPAPEKIEQMRQYSWGIPVNTLLRQIDSNLMTAYNLPIPETVAEVNTPELTGWLGELEATAKQITVRIDNNNGLSNGSGIIIAKEDNNYTVLTANHVICERDDATESCRDFVYEIVTHDGQKHPIEAETIRRQEGVDLAVVEFSSNKEYQVAQLADYPLTNYDAVFVAGYPKLSETTPAQWRFSLGYGLDREQGLLNLSDNSLTTDSGLTGSQGSLSGGYEMVYTSITYGGMSGGAVLDGQGRVIGIHGLAEGQTAIDSQSSSQKQIQLGYSLGIPVTTFIGLADRFEVESTLPIEEERPPQLSTSEIGAFQEAILGTEIPQGNATAEKWLERGNQLWRLQRYEEAVDAFDRVIVQEPEFVHLAHYGKGLALLHSRQLEAALESLLQATKTQPDFAPAFVAQSIVLLVLNRSKEALVAIDSAITLQLNRSEEALVAIDSAITLQPYSANLYNQKGMILFDLKRYREALADYNRAIAINPNSAYYNYRSLVYADQGKLDLALADHNKAIAINPNFASAYNNRGNLYSDQEKLDLALADYNKAIAIDRNFAEAYYNRGGLYKNQEKLEKALADYNKAIALDRNFAEAYYNRSLVYSDQEKLEKALDDYDRVIAIKPNFASAYYNRGNLYKNQGELDLALDDYDRVIAIKPNDADAYNNRGLVYKNQEKLEKALADYNKAIAIDRNYAGAYYNRGDLYNNQGELDLALADYNKAIAIDRNFAEAYNNRGLVYKNQEKLDLALADYNKAIAIKPNDADAYNNRGLVYKNQEKLDLALADYNKAIAINRNFAEAYYNRGNLYADQEKLEKALADFNKAIAINRNLAEAYYSRGGLYFDQGELDLALADFNKAIAINRNFAEAYYSRGGLYFDQGELDLALDDYDRAIAINRNDAEAYNNRGNLYFYQGELDLALDDYDRAIAINRNYAGAYYNRGLVYFYQEKVDKALADYNKAIAINRNYALAYNNRGLIYHNQRELDKALADYNKAIAINPNLALAYYNRGNLYFYQEKVDKALADYNKAIAINRNYAEAYGNLGLVYQEIGKLETARVHLQKAQQLFIAQGNSAAAEQVASLLQQLP